jgi:hypothetical protein
MEGLKLLEGPRPAEGPAAPPPRSVIKEEHGVNEECAAPGRGDGGSGGARPAGGTLLEGKPDGALVEAKPVEKVASLQKLRLAPMKTGELPDFAATQRAIFCET